MSAEREIMEWLEDLGPFAKRKDEKMRKIAIRVLSEHVQYDSYEGEDEN